MNVIIHYPKTLKGWHVLARHAAAVSELIELDRQGKLGSPLYTRVQLLPEDDEEDALERALQKRKDQRKKRGAI